MRQAVFRERVEEYHRRFKSARPIIRALLGDMLGTVEVPERPGYHYARTVTESQVISVLNKRTSPTLNLPVLIGYTDEEPDVLQVIDIVTDQIPAWDGTTYIGPHAASHEWGGGDVVFIDQRQFREGLPRAIGGWTVQVDEFFYRLGDTIYRMPSFESADLSGYVPVDPNFGNWVLLSYDPLTQSVTTTAGTAFDVYDTADPISFMPAIPAKSLVFGDILIINGDLSVTQPRIDGRRRSILGSSAPYLTAGVPGEVLFVGADGYVDEDPALFWDNINKTLLVGTNTNPLSGHPTYKAVFANEGAAVRVDSYVWSNNAGHIPFFIGRKARGTRASPAAVQNLDILAEFGGLGHSGSAWAGVAAMAVTASETFAPGSVGTRLDFYITPVGSASFVLAVGIDKILAVSEVVVTDAAGNLDTLPATSFGHTIEDEGVPLTHRTNLNFVGDGVIATDDMGGDASVITIPGGGNEELIWFTVR